jgi:murein DD-endopeptidase MepM/ murein hydrolase activator NlpD
MEEKTKWKKFFDRLKHKYRFIIYNDDTYQEVWYMKLSRLNIMALTGIIFIILITAIILILSFTPVKQLIPGFPSDALQRKIIQNAVQLDSLEKQIAIRDIQFADLKAIISGEQPKDQQRQQDTTKKYEQVDFSRSEYDSMLRAKIESEQSYNLVLNEQKSNSNNYANLFFFVPLKGIVTNSFNPDENHFGVDIVAAPNKFVSAVLNGTVTLATWTLETGYVISIQHENNLISIYKHNSVLLKKVGDSVKAGEAVAIVGSSGELSTGPHLHFELWQNGKPLNPEDYIIF